MELNEILFLARNMLKKRTDALKNDVKRCCFDECKDTQFAPFPALLYCFSTIDLLGALYGGNATGKKGKEDKKAEYRVSELSLKYMSDVMRYPKGRAYLLQRVFRHKIVHLAQPNPRTKVDSSEIRDDAIRKEVNSGLYRWALRHNERSLHLKIEDKQDEYCFCVSIWSLVEDIVDSVFGPNGYLHKLENDENCLQSKFKKAYCEIFV